MGKNYYKEALALLRENPATDLHKVALLVAEKNPKAFCDAFNKLSGKDWVSEVKRRLTAGEKITAIKIYRENTGLGLKEAKDAVEAMPEHADYLRAQDRIV